GRRWSGDTWRHRRRAGCRRNNGTSTACHRKWLEKAETTSEQQDEYSSELVGVRDGRNSFRTMYVYGQSKLANILHANELAKHFKEEGVEITANSLHPGVIATKILRHRWFVNGVLNKLAKYFFKSIPQVSSVDSYGAATTCYVALHPQVKGVSGEYFSDSNLAKPIALAKDEELAKKLWDFSLSLTDPK
ncbi:hypothetical protein C3L33_16045, partial [Rhododendron williamsianum]